MALYAQFQYKTWDESRIFLNLVLKVLVMLLPMASPSDGDCFINCLKGNVEKSRRELRREINQDLPNS